MQINPARQIVSTPERRNPRFAQKRTGEDADGGADTMIRSRMSFAPSRRKDERPARHMTGRGAAGPKHLGWSESLLPAPTVGLAIQRAAIGRYRTRSVLAAAAAAGAAARVVPAARAGQRASGKPECLAGIGERHPGFALLAALDHAVTTDRRSGRTHAVSRPAARAIPHPRAAVGRHRTRRTAAVGNALAERRSRGAR